MREFTDEEIKTLQMSALFRGLSSDALQGALSLLQADIRSYKKGAFLHTAGTPLPCFGLVIRGAVQACHDELEGRRCIMAEVSPGHTFGESLAYFGVQDSPVYITAATDCTVLWGKVPNQATLESLLKDIQTGTKSLEKTTRLDRYIDLTHRFMSLLAARTLSMNTRIQILSRPRLREKILYLLQDIAESSGSRDIELMMSREDMADYIGADRSALSRELARMKADGLIDYYKDCFRLL